MLGTIAPSADIKVSLGELKEKLDGPALLRQKMLHFLWAYYLVTVPGL